MGPGFPNGTQGGAAREKMRAVLPRDVFRGSPGPSRVGAAQEILRASRPRRARAALQHVVQALLQHASVAAPDRAEARAQVCAALCTVLAALPQLEPAHQASSCRVGDQHVALRRLEALLQDRPMLACENCTGERRDHFSVAPDADVCALGRACQILGLPRSALRELCNKI